MFWETKNQKNIEILDEKTNHMCDTMVKDRNRIDAIEEKIHKIDILLATRPDSLTPEQNSRLADLEVKMAKLWSLLLETTPLGKEKLSKFGKKFGGKSQL